MTIGEFVNDRRVFNLLNVLVTRENDRYNQNIDVIVDVFFEHISSFFLVLFLNSLAWFSFFAVSYYENEERNEKELNSVLINIEIKRNEKYF